MKRFVAVLAFAACLAGGAFAQVLGKIDYLEGDVTITRNGANVKKVDIGTSVENLDVIKTSADGLVSVAFDKASGLTGALQIVHSSTAVIRQEQIAGSSANEVQLLAGSVNLKVKRLAGVKSPVQIRTGTAVLGVRGTEFVTATFNGSVLVACKEGEVFCSSSSEYTVSRNSLDAGASAVPGTMVEVLESGKVNAAGFPEGDFDRNWNEMRDKWKSFQVDLVTENPVGFMNQFVHNWNAHSSRVESGYSALRSNRTLQAWLKAAAAGKGPGGMADQVREKPLVMKDLIAIRPDLMVSLITLYRLEELIPLVPESDMGRRLANGQTVGDFIAAYNRSSRTVADAMSLFAAAEKQYMLRNDGVSPFSEF